jgi:hypothetical protein
VSDPGGQTGDLSFPFDAHPGDRDPLECVQRVTLEWDRPGIGSEDDDDRLVLHPSTLAPKT